MVLRPDLPRPQSPALKRFRAKQQRRWLTFIGILVAIIVANTIILIGCSPGSKTHDTSGDAPAVDPRKTILPPIAPRAIRLDSEPTIRVRIRNSTQQIVLAGSRQLIVGPTDAQRDAARSYQFTAPLTITRRPAGFVIRSADGKGVSWALAGLKITSPDSRLIQVDGVAYPQTIVLHQDTNSTATFDAINHVLLETYLPGVLEKELYRSWHPTAFRAQAIAARSYAIFQLLRWQGRHYDLESTTASQAYIGANAGPKPLQAVAETRGIVLTYNERIVPGYYSSACGGTGQDAAIAFPNGQDIAPLRGRSHAAWCRASTRYRWGPVIRDVNRLSQRIRAWGKQNENRVMNLQSISRIDVTKTNAAGRPAQFTITDRTGTRYTLGPEEFRFACNTNARGLSNLTAKDKLYSSHVTIEVRGTAVRILEGRGYGHGVGMCQWGAQGMANAGIDAYRILGYYYPSSGLKRLY